MGNDFVNWYVCHDGSDGFEDGASLAVGDDDRGVCVNVTWLIVGCVNASWLMEKREVWFLIGEKNSYHC